MLPFRLCPLGLLVRILPSLWLAVAILSSGASFAHEGHDHGDATGSAQVSSAFPRVTARSDLYEAVGILKNDRLSVYLDHFATNEPVTDAKVTITVGDNDPIDAEPGADGVYTLSFPRLSGVQSVEVVFSITGHSGDDLLVGAIALPQATGPSPPAASGARAASSRWIDAIPPTVRNPVVLAIVAFGLGVLVGHFHRSGLLLPAMATGTAAGVVLLLLVAVALSENDRAAVGNLAQSTKAETQSDGPRRLPDGTAFIAKPTQRLLEVRTVAATPETVRTSVNLIGRVIGDPNRTSVVQSVHGGRIVPLESGVPRVGQRVHKGEVLVQVDPYLPLADRTTISEKTGEIEQLIAIAEARLRRLRPLAERGAVPASQVTDIELELEGLRARREVVRNTRAEREALRAPTDGVIAVAKVVPGQVVQEQDVLFQIVDPEGLWVEALVFGALDPNSLDEATAVTAGGQSAALAFRGFSRALQQHASVVHFAVLDTSLSLNIGQPVTVLAKSGTAITALVVPREALVRSGNGEAIVWLHVDPERFEARPVATQALDATRVVVSGGVTDGERIVVRGAELINQIR